MLFVFMTVLPVFAGHQGLPQGKWWHSPAVAKQIEITDGEKEKLDNLFFESRRKRIDLKSTVEKERLEFERLIDAKNLDENALISQFKRLEKARTNLATEIFGFLVEERKILGYERFQKLKLQYKEKHWGKKRMQKRIKDRRHSGNMHN